MVMSRLSSPGRALMALGVGHAAWGAVAYGRELREIASAGIVDSVGDGNFRDAHARGPRAAAFWFMMAAPLVGLSGYLADAAERAGDGRALQVSGRAIGAVCLLGEAVIPRSGFPGGLATAYWLERRGRALTRG
jgi:hypothetical protein